MDSRLFCFAIAFTVAGCVNELEAGSDRSGRLAPAQFGQDSNDNISGPFLSFAAAVALEATAATSANASVGDLNGDGHLDILLIKGRHWPLENRLLFGNGAGEFSAGVNLSEVSDRSYSGSLADLDLDGDLDVVISNDRPDESLIYLNNGNGVFAVSSTVGRADWPTRNASVADINDDGLPDVIVANRYGDNAGGNYICLNKGNGRFAKDCLRFSAESSTTITPADLNGDGLIDLVVPHRDGGQSLIYYQEKTADQTFRQVLFGPGDAVIRATQVADFDGDGFMDIVAINAGTSEGDDGRADDRHQSPGVSLFLGQSDVQFSEPILIGDSEFTPYSLSLGDINVDGAMDFLVGYVEAPSIVYFNNNDGSGFTAVPFGSGKGTVYGIDVGDLNRDGLVDVVAAKSGAVNAIYLGRADRPK